MKFFVKAKFPVEVRTDGIRVQGERKERFVDRDKAFDFIAVQLELGAVSVTIRPEAD